MEIKTWAKSVKWENFLIDTNLVNFLQTSNTLFIFIIFITSIIVIQTLDDYFVIFIISFFKY